MNFYPINTLAHYEAMPHKHSLNLGDLPLPRIAKAVKKYHASCDKANPDLRALEFYALNHYYSKVSEQFTRNEVLPSWAVTLCSTYKAVMSEQAERLMNYMLCIITREARHTHAFSNTLTTQVTEKFGPVMLEYLNQKVRTNNEDQAVKNLLTTPPDLACGVYVRAIEWVFDHGGYSGGYGGKPWGKIARTLGDFLYGKITLEMMVDTAYTLAHNNGPMFNKGMMYQNYTSFFMKILDVQRSGQIPELIKTYTEYSYIAGFMTDGLKEVTELAYQNLPEAFGQYVDWYKVKELGALSSLYNEIAAQDKKHGKPVVPVVPAPPPLPQQKTPFAVPTQVVLVSGAKATALGLFNVTDSESVQIYERVTA